MHHYWHIQVFAMRSPHVLIMEPISTEVLNKAVHEHKHVKTWIKPFAMTHDSWGVWLAFKAHYCGRSELEAIETAAEQ
jgi:hypothetical protein